MILVTGGTGFVGRHLVQELVRDGLPVRVLTRDPAAAALLPAGVQCLAADLSRDGGLEPLLRSVTAVVHLAARLDGPGVDPAAFGEVNARGTARLARAARLSGIRRLVHLSSAGVYGDGATAAPHREDDEPRPGSRYEESKLAGEAALRAELSGSETSWVILRPAGIYGPGRRATEDFVRRVRARRVWLHGPAAVIVHPTFVGDVTAAVRAALERPEVGGGVFNVGGERPLALPRWIAAVGRHAGRAPIQVRAPRALGLAAAGLSAAVRLAGRRPPARLLRLSRRIINRSLDTARARARLGLCPVPLEEGLARTVAWMRRERRL